MTEKKSNYLDKWYGKIISALLLFGLGAWFYSDLVKLETGKVESVRLWAPVVYLYEHFGFYTAVSIVPVIGLIFLIWGLKQLISGKE